MKKQLLIITIILLLNGLVFANSVYDNFEGVDYNSTHLWTWQSGYGHVSTAQKYNGAQSVLVNNSNLQTPTSIGSSFPGRLFSVWLDTNDVTQTNDQCLKLVNSAGTGLVYWCINNSHFEYYNGSYVSAGGSPANNTWYRLEVNYVDNNSKATYKAYNSSNTLLVTAFATVAGSGVVDRIQLENFHNTNNYFDLVTDGYIIPNSCTYGGSGDWNISLADNCNLATDTNIGNNKFFTSGVGSLKINAWIYCNEAHLIGAPIYWQSKGFKHN